MGRRLGFWRRFAVCVVKPPMVTFTRWEWRGASNVPRTGPAILVSNHISPADPLILSHFVYEAGRWPRFLAKSSLFRNRLVGKWLRTVGQIPVYRGTADAAKSLSAAEVELRRGEAIILYPEGTVSKQPQNWPMRGKTGVARLALMTGAPVIPIGQWGAQRVFDPVTKKVGVRFRNDVTIVAGPPVDMGKWQGVPVTAAVLQEVTDQIMYEIRDLVAEIRGERAPELYNPGGRS